ncbi:MAG: cytochrome c biogenesis protein ResB, partial [Actinomycetota bacterium]
HDKPQVETVNLEPVWAYREVDGDLESTERWLKKNKYRITKDESGISAEKGYLRETGNLIFHLSLIVVLLGVGASSVFGMRGEAIVTAGERFINVPTSYDNLAPGRFFNVANMPAFAITAANFEAKYDSETRQPLDYKLTGLVANSTKEKPTEKIVRVNQPLTFGDSRVYLQANGFSPLVTVRDKNGEVKFEGPVPFLP